MQVISPFVSADCKRVRNVLKRKDLENHFPYKSRRNEEVIENKGPTKAAPKKEKQPTWLPHSTRMFT
jgi:hypothetical protein